MIRTLASVTGIFSTEHTPLFQEMCQSENVFILLLKKKIKLCRYSWIQRSRCLYVDLPHLSLPDLLSQNVATTIV